MKKSTLGDGPVHQVNDSDADATDICAPWTSEPAHRIEHGDGSEVADARRLAILAIDIDD